ncbi:hypothetical protein PVK06_000500 [Gossypium arboreum]|uniref:RNase H type-1 domain-containing protein n=1 Tax=Gossypium arboreum TaxID=29729 RepID=A0ABR0QYR9_GOSAR|nr:hypothetical protein PVK06_000500 [Gossypium arboreum]
MGRLKINTDGAMDPVSGLSVGGLQDFDAGWIFGFARNLGSMSVFQAEAGAMYEGLGLAWDKVGCKVEVESDNALSIIVVKNTYADYNGLVYFNSPLGGVAPILSWDISSSSICNANVGGLL